MEQEKQIRNHNTELLKALTTIMKAEDFLFNLKKALHNTSGYHRIKDAYKGLNYARRCINVVIRELQNYLLEKEGELKKGGGT